MSLNARALITRLLHNGVFCFQAIRRSVWFFTQPDAIGVHAIPITLEGKIVLVELSYAPGWRLPGGGIKKNEDCETAVLRELREEIGLMSYQTVVPVTEFAHRPDHRKGNGSLFIVRGVQYQPKWSLEIKRVAEFDLDRLPRTTARISHQLLAVAKQSLSTR